MFETDFEANLINKAREKTTNSVDVVASLIKQYRKSSKQESFEKDIKIIKDQLTKELLLENNLENALKDKEETLKELIEEIVKFKFNTEIDIENNVKIGSVYPSIPPTNIHIEEVKGGKIVGGIRANNTYQIKNGKGSIRISLSFTFPNKSLINNELFPLIGELRTCPITVIESKYIRDTINGYILSTSKNDQINSLENTIKKDLEKIDIYYEKIISLFQDLGYLYDDIAGEGKVIDRNRKVEENIEAIKKKYIDASLELSIKHGSKDEYNDKVLAKISTLSWELEETSRRVNRLLSQRISQLSTNIRYLKTARVPVILESIILQNTRETPNSIDLQLTFYYLNVTPDVDSLLYKGLNGSWTPLPEESPLWLAYVHRRITDPNDLNMKKVEITEEQDPIVFNYPLWDSSISKVDLNLKEAREYVDNRKKDRDDPRYFRSLIINEGNTSESVFKNENTFVLKDTIIDSVQVGISSSVVPFTTLSSKFPTFQYLGSNRSNAIIRLITTYEELKKLQDIKYNLDRISISSGSKAYRINYLAINNLFVLDLLGINTFQIEAINYNTVNTDRVVVDLQLSFFRPIKHATTKLKLIQEYSSSTSRSLVTFILNKLVKWAAEYLQIDKKDLTEDGKPYDSNKVHLQQAYSILHGWENEEGRHTGILTPRFWKAYIKAYTNRESRNYYSVDLFNIRPVSKSNKTATIVLDRKERLLEDKDEFLANKIWNIVNFKKEQKKFEDNLIGYRELWKSETFVKRAVSILFRDDINRKDFEGNELPEDLILDNELLVLVSIPVFDSSLFSALSLKINREIYKSKEFNLDPYPDLNLPTYNELFSELIESILEVAWEVDPPSAPVLTPSSETFSLVSPVSEAVIDGDTIKVLYNSKSYRVRLLNINTREKGTFGAKAAEKFLERVLSEGQVSLEDKNGNPITSLPGPDLDVYGRTLAYVKVGGTLVNELIVKNGWSEYWTALGSAPSSYESLFINAQSYAEANKKGLYGITFGNEDFEDLSEIWPKVLPKGFRKNNLFPDFIDTNTVNSPLIDKYLPKRNGNSRLDPDFFFYGSYVNKTLLSTFDETVQKDMDLLLGNTEEPIIESELALVKSLEKGKKWISDKFNNDKPINKSKVEEWKKANKKLEKQKPEIGSLDVRKTVNVTQEDLQEGNSIGTFDPEDKNDVKSILRKAITQSWTLDNRLINTFPTVQIFLIKEESGFLTKYSDWYGYNNVVSCSVTRHKFQPDICTLSITNPVGILEELTWDSEEVSLDSASFARRESEKSPVSKRKQREKEEKLLGKFPSDKVKSSSFSGENGLFLTEGTKIVVKMGYSANTDELITVFTGKVAELQKGDQINIVAQGNAGELTFPLVAPEEKESTIDLHTAWGKILRILGFKTSRPHPILTLVHELLSRSPSEDFGDWGIKQIIRHRGDIDTYLNDYEKATAGIIGTLPILGSFIKAMASDPKLENVGGFAYPILKRTVDIDFLDNKSEWIIKPEMTAISVLRDITLQYPEYMWCVLPYDDRSTIYFGPPNGFYFDSGKYRLLKSKLRRLNRQINKEDIESQIERFFIQEKVFEKVNERLSKSILFKKVNVDITNPRNSKETTDLIREIDNDETEALRLPILVKDVFGDESVGYAVIETLIDILVFFPDFNKDYGGFYGFDNKAYKKIVNAIVKEIDNDSKKVPNYSYIGQKLGLFEPGLDKLSQLPIETKVILYTNHTRANKLKKRKFILEFLKVMKEIKIKKSLPLFFTIRERKRLINKILDSGAQPVVRYHFIDSKRHILANNIIATRGVMANTLHITRTQGSNNTVIVSVDDDLKEGEHVISQVAAPNAENNEELWRAGYGHLAEAMRPMYRGDIVIRGNPNIKPYDVVWINDTYNKMWGPIEVERVTHNFDFQTGFTTTITPHLYCRATGHASWWATQGAGMLAANIAIAGLTTGGMILFSSITAPISALLYISAYLYSTKKIGDFITEDILDLGTGLYGLALGRGNYGGERTPLAISPLMYNGEPFVAAMEGYKKDKFSIWKPLEKRFERIRRGWRRFIATVEKGYETLGDLGE